MKISLIHPSRGRPEKAKQTYDYWIENSSHTIKIEHILSIDFDDDKYMKYAELHEIGSTICTNNNENVVEATNHAAKLATGNILIYLSDDFKCPKNWDEIIESKFMDNWGYRNYPLLLKVDDCLQKFDVAVLTIPIMNRELYEKLGYFWHPGYKSMFVDEDLYWTCRKNNWLTFCEGLKFPHEHCSIGKAERDETYIRSEKNWNQGKELFAKRKLENFPL